MSPRNERDLHTRVSLMADWYVNNCVTVMWFGRRIPELFVGHLDVRRTQDWQVHGWKLNVYLLTKHQHDTTTMWTWIIDLQEVRGCIWSHLEYDKWNFIKILSQLVAASDVYSELEQSVQCKKSALSIDLLWPPLFSCSEQTNGFYVYVEDNVMWSTEDKVGGQLYFKDLILAIVFFLQILFHCPWCIL